MNGTVFTAALRYALTSDRKMLLLAKLVRHTNVSDALRILQFTPKKAAHILYKVIRSASSNAYQKAGLMPDNLFIKEILVGRGPKLKRIRFASRSRIHGYVKHRCFVKVILHGNTQ